MSGGEKVNRLKVASRGERAEWKRGLSLLGVVFLSSMVFWQPSQQAISSRDVKKETDILRINLLDGENTPNLAIQGKNKKYALEYSDGQYKFTTFDAPLMSFDEKKLDTQKLVFEMESPYFYGPYTANGFKVWKLIHSDIDFKSKSASMKKKCGTLTIYGGPCKASKVSLD